MSNRNHSKSRSPAKRDTCRMSQASTIAASSQSDSLMLALTPTRADLPVAQLPALPQSPGALPQDISSPVLASPFAQSCPTPAPAPVSGPSPAVHLAHSDPFARARIAAVQSRVAAPVLSDPRPPPPVPVFSPFRDGHYWCSKCPRRGFTTIPGLMRHVTHQHAGSSVDEATCSLFTAIERVTCTAPACGGLRRMGARVCMAQGRDDYAQLEEGRSKLLLSTVPQDLSVATEVFRSVSLSGEERSFETLLQRAEEQLLLKRKAGKRRKSSGPTDPSERGDRARRTAAAGAYRKATTGLVSSMLSFTEQEDMRWAQELLPTPNLGLSAHCDPDLAPPPALPESHLGQALLWFALCGSHCSDRDSSRAHHRPAQCPAQDSC